MTPSTPPTAAAATDELAGAPATERRVTFVRPLPGLDGLLAYRLDPLDPAGGDGVLFTLTSLDDPAVELLVAVPWAFFPDYAPEVDTEDADALGLASAEDALLFVVVTPGESAAGSTANLLAPVVVHRSTMRAAQVLLTGTDQPLRAPLAA